MNAALLGPRQRDCADVFRPIVAADRLRLAAPFDDLVERSNNTLGRQRKIHVDDQAFTIEIIDHVEQADAATVAQLVVHEVHLPDLIHRRGNSQRQWPFAHEALTRLDAQVQFECPVDPVDALVVPLKALHIAQIQEAQAEAPVALIGGQTDQPVCDDLVLGVKLGLVTEAGLADAKRQASQADRCAPLVDHTARHLTALRWRYHFFARASATISALRRSSAYIFFRRLFSSSSSFIRAMSEASMPPNLARHL